NTFSRTALNKKESISNLPDEAKQDRYAESIRDLVHSKPPWRKPWGFPYLLVLSKIMYYEKG
ncbi:MAG: hypothetical protein IIZ39_02465, partial [Blautia sp.]|nr:hypothetical protein [Blautia sp.]